MALTYRLAACLPTQAFGDGIPLQESELIDVQKAMGTSWGAATLRVPMMSTDSTTLISANLATWKEVVVIGQEIGSPTEWEVARYVVTNPDMAADTWRLAGKGWHLAQVNVGRADRVNQLTNGSFETGTLTGWTAEDTTATVVADRSFAGGYSVKLEQTQRGKDAYLWQTFSSPPNGVGVEWTAVAVAFIEHADWIGPAFGRRGLFMQRGGTGISTNFNALDARILNETPHGAWIRFKCTLNVPPDTADTVQVRLYSPGGTIWWDEVFVVQQESISIIEQARSVAVTALLDHAQDTAFNRVDLGIPTGATYEHGWDDTKLINRTWQFASHARISGALDEIAALEPGGTWWCDGNSGVVFDRIDDTAGAQVTLSSAQIVQRTRCAIDLSEARSSIIGLSQGSDGPDRDEAGAIDTGAFGGTMVLEEILAAPSGTTVDGLQDFVDARLVAKRRPWQLSLIVGGVTVGTTTYNAADAFLGGHLQPGTMVGLTGFSVGVHDQSGVWQCLAVRWTPKGNTLAVDLRWAHE